MKLKILIAQLAIYFLLINTVSFSQFNSQEEKNINGVIFSLKGAYHSGHNVSIYGGFPSGFGVEGSIEKNLGRIFFIGIGVDYWRRNNFAYSSSGSSLDNKVGDFYGLGYRLTFKWRPMQEKILRPIIGLGAGNYKIFRTVTKENYLCLSLNVGLDLKIAKKVFLSLELTQYALLGFNNGTTTSNIKLGPTFYLSQ